MSSTLSVQDLIQAQVLLSPTAAPTQTFGTLLILGSSAVIDVVQRYRPYSTLLGVEADFGTATPEALAAIAFYSQSPQPVNCLVGRWAQLATSGLLHGATLSATQQTLSSFTAIVSGGMNLTIDGTLVALTGLNFSSAMNLNGVAALLTTALGVHGTSTWNASLNRFEFVSASSGITSSVSVGSPPATGVDISGLVGSVLGMPVAGIAAETFAAAVAALAAATNAWYGVTPASATPPTDTDLLATASFIEALNPRRFFAVTTQESGAWSSTSTTDFAALAQAAGYTHTAPQFSSTSPYAAASLFGRQASVNFAANNSTITLMYKQQPTITPESLTEGQAAALKAKNCNVFANYSNSTAIVQWGTVASGLYIDTIVGTDWLQNALQTALFNVLYTSTTKAPQTDAGVNMLVTAADVVLAQALSNGLIAPGVWLGPPIGAIVTGQTLPKGFYVYAPPVATQTLAQLAARAAPPLQICIKLGGAIHTASLLINVSQ
jgi:hypothetical protein